MAFNDENCPPFGDEMSIHSAKSGAAAVFGSAIFGSEVPDHSLCYSPSPLANRHVNVVLNNQEIKAKNSGLDGKVLSFDKATTSADKSSPKKREYKKTPYKPKSSDDGENSVQSVSSESSNSKRNAPPPKTQLNNSIISRISEESDNLTTNSSNNNISVNPVINNVRRSKEENIKKKNLSVAELREQRRLETAEAAAFNAEAERTRREVIELRKKLSERFRKAKVEREQKLRQEHLKKVENEIQFKSRVHVEHKQTLKENEDARRRMSIADRAKLRKNNMEGKEKMRMMAIQEEQAILDERHESSVAMKTAKSDNAEKRRMSYAFRNGDARRIRQLFADRESERRVQEQESLELKWAGERDVEDYKEQLAEQRRKSLAFRNAEGKRIRDLESKMKTKAGLDEHESYELKWAGERDAEDYRKQLEQEERDDLAFRNAEGRRIRDDEVDLKVKAQSDKEKSYELKWAGERDAEDYKKHLEKEEREDLAFRNAEGRRIRDLETTMKAKDSFDEHESYELKWAGERDAEDYKRLLAQEERDDLAYRNEEARYHDAVMKELADLAKEQEHESYILKWAGENDAKEYLEEEEELRRQSLEFRNLEGRRHRELDEEERENDIMRSAENEALNAACQRDVQQYKDACAARDRASLVLRGKEDYRKRLESENKRQLQSKKDHESHLLDTQAWQDVNDYVKECKERKRLSLAFRAKEKRRHADYAKRLHQKKIQRQQMDTHYRSEDARYIEMARLKEKARIALEALEQPPCSFNANPFDKLMR